MDWSIWLVLKIGHPRASPCHHRFHYAKIVISLDDLGIPLCRKPYIHTHIYIYINCSVALNLYTRVTIPMQCGAQLCLLVLFYPWIYFKEPFQHPYAPINHSEMGVMFAKQSSQSRSNGGFDHLSHGDFLRMMQNIRKGKIKYLGWHMWIFGWHLALLFMFPTLISMVDVLFFLTYLNINGWCCFPYVS